jgi:hypothetical protein
MENNLVTEYQKNGSVDKVKNINKSFPGHQNANIRAKLKMNEVEKILRNFNNANI